VAVRLGILVVAAKWGWSVRGEGREGQRLMLVQRYSHFGEDIAHDLAIEALCNIH
jgi:hypothetical protein